MPPVSLKFEACFEPGAAVTNGSSVSAAPWVRPAPHGGGMDRRGLIREGPPPAPAPRRGSDGMVRSAREAAADAAQDLSAFVMMIDNNLDVMASDSLSPGGASALLSLRVASTHLRGLAHELRQAATDPGACPPHLVTNLGVWWPEMMVLLRAVHREDVTIRADIPPGLPAARIKPQHLTQVVFNLVENATHAITEAAPRAGDAPGDSGASGRGTIVIAAVLVQGGRAIRLTVIDNGAGMSPAVQTHAGEPSFTTRADRGGTGLGLAMVQRLVGGAGGHVRISSVQGAGTTVAFDLPCDGGSNARGASATNAEVSA